MSDVNGIAGSMDTIRLSVEEQAAAARAEKRATARGNLAALLVDQAGGLEAVGADDDAARLVAAEFAELCDVLGLEPPPERPPGLCGRCGRPLRLETSVRPKEFQRRGYCSTRCMRLANLRNVEEVE